MEQPTASAPKADLAAAASSFVEGNQRSDIASAAPTEPKKNSVQTTMNISSTTSTTNLGAAATAQQVPSNGRTASSINSVGGSENISEPAMAAGVDMQVVGKAVVEPSSRNTSKSTTPSSSPVQPEKKSRFVVMGPVGVNGVTAAAAPKKQVPYVDNLQTATNLENQQQAPPGNKPPRAPTQQPQPKASATPADPQTAAAQQQRNGPPSAQPSDSSLQPLQQSEQPQQPAPIPAALPGAPVPATIVGMVGTTPIVRLAEGATVVKKKKGRFNVLQEVPVVQQPTGSGQGQVTTDTNTAVANASTPQKVAATQPPNETVVAGDASGAKKNEGHVVPPPSDSSSLSQQQKTGDSPPAADATAAPVVKRKGRFVITSVTDPNLIAQGTPMVPITLTAAPTVIATIPTASSDPPQRHSSPEKQPATGLMYTQAQAAVMMPASTLVPQQVMYTTAAQAPTQPSHPESPEPAQSYQTEATESSSPEPASGTEPKQQQILDSRPATTPSGEAQKQQPRPPPATTRTRPNLASQKGLGKVYYFLDQMRSEVTEADRTIKGLHSAMKSLQTDMKFLKEKNKELEAKAREAERKLGEERALREAAEGKLKALRKRMRELKEEGVLTIMNGLTRSDSVDPNRESTSSEFFQPVNDSTAVSAIQSSGEPQTLPQHKEPLNGYDRSVAGGQSRSGSPSTNADQTATKEVPQNGHSVASGDNGSRSTDAVRPTSDAQPDPGAMPKSNAEPLKPTSDQPPTEGQISGPPVSLSPPREAGLKERATSNGSRMVRAQSTADTVPKPSTTGLGTKSMQPSENPTSTQTTAVPPQPSQNLAVSDFDPLRRPQTAENQSAPAGSLAASTMPVQYQQTQVPVLMMEQQTMAYPIVGVANVEGMGIPTQPFVQMPTQQTMLSTTADTTSMPETQNHTQAAVGYQNFASNMFLLQQTELSAQSQMMTFQPTELPAQSQMMTFQQTELPAQSQMMTFQQAELPHQSQMMTFQQPIIQWQGNLAAPSEQQAINWQHSWQEQQQQTTQMPRQHKSVADFDPLLQDSTSTTNSQQREGSAVLDPFVDIMQRPKAGGE